MTTVGRQYPRHRLCAHIRRRAVDSQSLFRDSGLSQAPRSRRAQFDHLGAGRRADGLLFHQRRCVGAPFASFLRRPDRHFGDVLRAMWRSAWPAAVAAESSRPTPTTFWRARWRAGAYEPRGVTPTQSPSMTFSSHPTSSACCSTRWDATPGHCARFRQSRPIRRLRYSAGGAGSDREDFDARAVSEAENQRRDRPHLSRVGLCARPAHGDGGSRRAGAARGRSSTPVGRWRPRIRRNFPRRSSAPSASASSCRRVSRQFLPPRSGSPGSKTMKARSGLHRGPRARDAPRDKV